MRLKHFRYKITFPPWDLMMAHRGHRRAEGDIQVSSCWPRFFEADIQDKEKAKSYTQPSSGITAQGDSRAAPVKNFKGKNLCVVFFPKYAKRC